MARREDIIAMIPTESLPLVEDIVDEVIFLESHLEELRTLPFIQVHPKDNAKQRNTPAAKMYKEFLQQYVNCIKAIEYVIYRDKRLENDDVTESPLRTWFNAHNAG